MLIAALCFFALAFVLGVVILFSVINGRPTRKPVVFLHGGVALSALTLVVIRVVIDTGESPLLSLVFFGLATLGGLTLFTRDLLKKPLWIWLALLHPVLAAIGIILLLAFIMGV